MLILERKIKMLFSKKKKDSKVTLMHYEGLQGFRQDFPCEAETDDTCIIFINENNGTAKLPYSQIQTIDYMQEVYFMGKYHNNPVSTAKMGVKWFSVVSYTSSSGENKYLAFWSVDSTGRKFFDEIRSKISSGSITL